MADKNIDYAKKVFEKLKEEGIRTEIDERNESIGKKVRDALTQKINYIVTIGDKEEKANEVAVKNRDGKDVKNFETDKFIEKVKKEIDNKE